MFITLRSAVVVDGFAELADAHRAFSAEVSGRRVSLQDVFAAASRLERAYATRGFVLARVIVPPQRIDNGGVLRVRVIDGYIEDVELKGVPESQRAVVRSRMRDLIGRGRVTQDELERRLLLITEMPGLRVRSTIAPGTRRDGATLVVLEGTHAPLSGSIGADNRSSPSMGGGSINYSLSANGVLGYGEQAYLMASSGLVPTQLLRNSSELAMIGGGVTIPLGNDGLSLNIEGVRSATRAQPQPFSPRTLGTMTRVEGRIVYPWIKTQRQSLTFQGSYLWMDQRLDALDFGQSLYIDRYHVARFQTEYRTLLPGGMNFEMTATYSRGLGGRGQAAATATGIGLSRANADPRFDKFVLVMRFNATLPHDLQLSVVARAQTTFNRAMLVGESLALDGLDSLSGLTPGSFSADQGGTVRVELARPVPFAIEGMQVIAAPYFFGAYGLGFIVNPDPTQHGRRFATTVGLGARVNVAAPPTGYGASFGIEYARSQLEPVGSIFHRINLSASLRF